jgi:hypothetical protein
MDETPLLGAVSHNGEEVASDAKRLAGKTFDSLTLQPTPRAKQKRVER